MDRRSSASSAVDRGFHDRAVAEHTAATGSKTVIPCNVKGKFSIRLVPNLTIKSVTDLVVKYVNEEFKKLGSKNRCECVLGHGGEPWLVCFFTSSVLQLQGKSQVWTAVKHRREVGLQPRDDEKSVG